MAQHDYDIANQTFPSFRSDLNSVLEAINTSNSGTSRPSSAVAGTIWLDTTSATTPTLKFYDGADDISLATLDYTANTVNWIDSTVVFDIVNDTTPQLGGNLDVNGNSLVSTSNGNITFTPDGTGKVVISGLSYPTADGTSGQAIVTDGCGNLSFASIEGRTGTVDWDTTAKTASFTAVSGNGYFVNTTSGAITVTLPAGSPGDIVGISDYASTFQTNNVTITPNGTDKINGANEDATLSTQGLAVSLVYVDSTRGWKSVTGSDSDITGNPPFIVATGGTITTCGNCKIHTFTGPGTFCVASLACCSANNEISYMVVAGGGGGGDGGTTESGGGGGAGGFREDKSPVTTYTASPLDGAGPITVTATGYPITVGGGGSPGCSSPSGGNTPGTNGSNSVFSTITSAGGGGGTSGGASAGFGGTGGSGGGGNGRCGPGTPGNMTGRSGNTPPVSPPQGNNGGNGAPTPASFSGGGGGGATAVGGNASAPNNGGAGGTGATTNISGSPVGYAGGGGGGTRCNSGNPSPATQGGGAGGTGNGTTAPSGTANRGGGGGGTGGPNTNGGAGGSGIVIIRYKYQ